MSETLAAPKLDAVEVSILLDRLYRKYIREEEMDRAAELMFRVRQQFKQTAIEEVDLRGMRAKAAVTRLDGKTSNLLTLFATYFDSFSHCRESAELFKQSWNMLQLIRLVVADTPDFMLEEKRPLSQYDELQGRPFWLRHIQS